MELRDIEEAVYPGPRKLDIIKTLESEDHDYLSIAVCRNPVEKLLSVYHVMQDPKVKLMVAVCLQINEIFMSGS